MSVEEIQLEDETDRWKWVCPRGHRTWEPTNDHFWCHSCAQTYDIDGVFHQLRNAKTGAVLEREQIVLQTPAGPYRELYKGETAEEVSADGE